MATEVQRERRLILANSGKKKMKNIWLISFPGIWDLDHYDHDDDMIIMVMMMMMMMMMLIMMMMMKMTSFMPEKIHAASSDLIPNCFSIDERTSAEIITIIIILIS